MEKAAGDCCARWRAPNTLIPTSIIELIFSEETPADQPLAGSANDQKKRHWSDQSIKAVFVCNLVFTTDSKP